MILRKREKDGQRDEEKDTAGTRINQRSSDRETKRKILREQGSPKEIVTERQRERYCGNKGHPKK